MYGYFEMRAKLPKGTGTWPAFWLLSVKGIDKKTRPYVNMELDVLEQYGHWPNKLCTTTHYWYSDNTHDGDGENFAVPGMADDFHTYGVLVTPEKLAYYFDRRELRSCPTPEGAKQAFYLLVNLTLGPGWPLDKTPESNVMEVDYVRAWAKK
jgi:beta-glucanase (GH16 family)